MNTLPAKELKRRGAAALEAALEKGPVHIIKNNRPTCVVLSEEDYSELVSGSPDRGRASLWTWLDRPSLTARSRRQIDHSLKGERESWDAS